MASRCTQDDSTYVNGRGIRRVTYWNGYNGSTFVLSYAAQQEDRCGRLRRHLCSGRLESVEWRANFPICEVKEKVRMWRRRNLS